MALLGNCFCCSLGIASGFFAVYLLVSALQFLYFKKLFVVKKKTRRKNVNLNIDLISIDNNKIKINKTKMKAV